MPLVGSGLPEVTVGELSVVEVVDAMLADEVVGAVVVAGLVIVVRKSPSSSSGLGTSDGPFIPLSVGTGGASPALSGAGGHGSSSPLSGRGKMEGISSPSSPGGASTVSGAPGSGTAAGAIPKSGSPKGLSRTSRSTCRRSLGGRG